MPIVSKFPSGGGGGIKLSSIAITTPPVKLEYITGETFDPAGMEVTATYSNGATALATGYIFSPSTPLEDGTQSVTIQYTESGVTKTDIQAITVIHRLKSINVTTNPAKTAYEYSDAFDPAGMVVTAAYSDGLAEEVTGYQWEPLTFQSLGSQTVGITYSEGNVQSSTMISVTVERKTIPSVPTQSGTLTYTGGILTPQWDGYDPLQVTIGGVASGMNAGDHTATFTPTANYRWWDSTTEEKSAVWSIGKAVGILTLSKTSISLTAAAKVDTITVTRAGTGSITAVSSNTAIATVSVSGTTVTVTGIATGSATVTVSVGADANHTAPENETCSVAVQFYNPVLNDNSWATIRQASASGEASNLWSVGDRKAVLVNGTVGTLAINQTLYAFIFGFNHNPTYEGNGIHFGTFKSALSGGTDLCLTDGKYINGATNGTKFFNMNHWSNLNYGGWAGCDLRYDVLGSTNKAPSGYGSTKTTSTVGYNATTTTATSPVANTLMAALPSDLRAVMQPMTKYTDAVGNYSNVAANVKASIDYLPLLAEFEIFGTRSYSNQYEQNYQAQYQFYKNGNSKVKYRHNSTVSTAHWWGRSPNYSAGSYFCFVTNNSTTGHNSAQYSFGLAPAFKI